MKNNSTYTAFAGCCRVASGPLAETVLKVKELQDRGEYPEVLFFEDATGRQIDFDLRGTPDETLQRLSEHPHLVGSAVTVTPRPGPGRPKLGVVCREVSLLPRHWDWLQRQSGGASAALRRLVDGARKNEDGHGQVRRAQEAAGKFMWAMAGNLPDFEEASRALYAGDQGRLGALIQDWPQDIRAHLERLLAASADNDQ